MKTPIERRVSLIAKGLRHMMLDASNVVYWHMCVLFIPPELLAPHSRQRQSRCAAAVP